MVDHSIKGKAALVANGVRNLDGLIVRDLTVHGAKAIIVHYNGVTSKANAGTTVAALQAAGVKAVALQGDPTSAATMRRLLADAIAAMGKPGIAINTVGKVLKKPFAEISKVEYNEMSAVNAKSVLFSLRGAGKHVNGNGKICILVTSLFGVYTPHRAAYTGTKAPVGHFTRAAFKELDVRGTSATAVGPGLMDTPFFYPAEGVDAVAYHKTAAALLPFSRTDLTDIEDVVLFIRHLVNEGWWITDQTILVSGGYATK